MDARETAEQAELRRTARQLAQQLGPRTVVDLDDGARAERLARALRDAGLLELRHDSGDGTPLASGVEAGIVADALGEGVANAAFAGPVLAADLARRAGAPPADDAVVAFAGDLIGPAQVRDAVSSAALCAVDCAPGTRSAYVLVPEGAGFRLATVELEPVGRGADLTRGLRAVAKGSRLAAVPGQRGLSPGDLAAWSALGLAITSNDLLGVMRGVLDRSVEYAAQRKQYGVAVGSFQAVQHLLAEARCLLEGSQSAAQHAAWAVDALAPDEALAAGRVAKAYCARAARTVCETAVQVHGGIGNTWECIVHVYLRRARLSAQWFGDDGVQLAELQRTRLGVAHGLP